MKEVTPTLNLDLMLTVNELMEVFEKRRIGGWEKVSGLIGFKLQPEENRKNGILKISSWKEILQHANRRVFYTVLACVEQSVFECACVCSKPVMLRGLCKVSAAVVLSSASSAVWRAALCFSWDPLGFERLNFKAAGGGFWFSFQSFTQSLPASLYPVLHSCPYLTGQIRSYME